MNETSKPNITTVVDKEIYNWFKIRQKVAGAGWILNESVFFELCELFNSFYSSEDTSLTRLTREYNREEFIQVINQQGWPANSSDKMFIKAEILLHKHPTFSKWFQFAKMADGRPVLLVGRWLCHLVGFIHGTVEIFIDLPGLEGFTLVQVRGIDKFEAPGTFDIPCAGHMSGIDSADASLQKELGEELNLSLDDLSNFRQVTEYFFPAVVDQPDVNSAVLPSINNEFRVLYQAEIKREAVSHIRFTDGEVAGLAVFEVEALRSLVERYPERAASGLKDAMKYYRSP